jgi:acyl-CoA thioester hydrolase
MNSSADRDRTEQKPLFSTDIVVRIGDINYGGHMGNDRYLLLFHEARLRFLRSLGCSEADIGEGISLIMSEAHITYSGEVIYADELTVEVGIEEFTAIRFTVTFTVWKKKPVSGEAGKRPVASGYTVMAGFDYARKRPAKVPESFKTKIRTLQTGPGD